MLKRLRLACQITQYLVGMVQQKNNCLLYSSRAGDDVEKVDLAIKMLMELQRRAEDENALRRIVGYPDDLNALGSILRHVSVSVMKSSPNSGFFLNEKIT